MRWKGVYCGAGRCWFDKSNYVLHDRMVFMQNFLFLQVSWCDKQWQFINNWVCALSLIQYKPNSELLRLISSSIQPQRKAHRWELLQISTLKRDGYTEYSSQSDKIVCEFIRDWVVCAAIEYVWQKSIYLLSIHQLKQIGTFYCGFVDL